MDMEASLAPHRARDEHPRGSKVCHYAQLSALHKLANQKGLHFFPNSHHNNLCISDEKSLLLQQLQSQALEKE